MDDVTGLKNCRSFKLIIEFMIVVSPNVDTEKATNNLLRFCEKNVKEKSLSKSLQQFLEKNKQNSSKAPAFHKFLSHLKRIHVVNSRPRQSQEQNTWHKFVECNETPVSSKVFVCYQNRINK